MHPTNPDDQPVHDALKNIEDSAQRIIDGVELVDPDAISEALDLERNELQTGLAELMADPDQDPTAELDFTACVYQICTALHRDGDSDVHLQCLPCSTAMPMPAMDADQRDAMVQRLAHLALDHAGQGGELQVSLSCDDANVCVQILSRCSLGKAETVPPELHYRSVEAFVRDCGASLCWVGAGREIEFNLRLPRS